MTHTYHSNPPGGPFKDHKSQDPLDVIVNSKEESIFDKSMISNKRNMVSLMSVSSVVQARKIRELKEQDVKKLHNRIALLQAEEERALKKIEETKVKAHSMLENKLQQEQYARDRYEKKETDLAKARGLVIEKRGEKESSRIKVMMVHEKKKMDAQAVKMESMKLQKILEKNEKKYLRRAQEKRFEQ